MKRWTVVAILAATILVFVIFRPRLGNECSSVLMASAPTPGPFASDFGVAQREASLKALRFTSARECQNYVAEYSDWTCGHRYVWLWGW